MSRLEGMGKPAPKYTKNKITIILEDLEDGKGGVDISIQADIPMDLNNPETNAEQGALIMMGSLQDKGKIEFDRAVFGDGKVVTNDSHT